MQRYYCQKKNDADGSRYLDLRFMLGSKKRSLPTKDKMVKFVFPQIPIINLLQHMKYWSLLLVLQKNFFGPSTDAQHPTTLLS